MLKQRGVLLHVSYMAITIIQRNILVCALPIALFGPVTEASKNELIQGCLVKTFEEFSVVDGDRQVSYFIDGNPRTIQAFLDKSDQTKQFSFKVPVQIKGTIEVGGKYGPNGRYSARVIVSSIDRSATSDLCKP